MVGFDKDAAVKDPLRATEFFAQRAAREEKWREDKRAEKAKADAEAKAKADAEAKEAEEKAKPKSFPQTEACFTRLRPTRYFGGQTML